MSIYFAGADVTCSSTVEVSPDPQLVAENTELKAENLELQSTVSTQTAEITTLTESINANTTEINNLNNIITSKNTEIENLTTINATKTAEIETLTSQLDLKVSENVALQEALQKGNIIEMNSTQPYNIVTLKLNSRWEILSSEGNFSSEPKGFFLVDKVTKDITQLYDDGYSYDKMFQVSDTKFIVYKNYNTEKIFFKIDAEAKTCERDNTTLDLNVSGLITKLSTTTGSWAYQGSAGNGWLFYINTDTFEFTKLAYPTADKLVMCNEYLIMLNDTEVTSLNVLTNESITSTAPATLTGALVAPDYTGLLAYGQQFIPYDIKTGTLGISFICDISLYMAVDYAYIGAGKFARQTYLIDATTRTFKSLGLNHDTIKYYHVFDGTYHVYLNSNTIFTYDAAKNSCNTYTTFRYDAMRMEQISDTQLRIWARDDKFSCIFDYTTKTLSNVTMYL